MSRHKLILLAGSLSLAAAGQEPHGEDERSYLMRRQQEIFRLNVEIDYALALQKLCQTGFGDPRLCAPAIPKSASAPPPMPQEPPTLHREPKTWILQDVAGSGNDFTATFISPDGRHLVAHPGALLPGGTRVIAIEANRVLIQQPGQAASALSLTGAEPVSADVSR